jgi:YD repeat-containing protein
MTVSVVNNDGTEITYGYDPEHRVGVEQFYSELVQEGKIKKYTIFLGN